MPDLPTIRFSSWVPWSERTTSLDDVSLPGVYLLAHLEDPPAGNASPHDPAVLYIGETGRSLRGRWRQFERSADAGKQGHSGGHTYRKEFREIQDELHVAAFPVPEFDEKLQPLFIRYAERKLLLDFALQHGSSPPLNRK